MIYVHILLVFLFDLIGVHGLGGCILMISRTTMSLCSMGVFFWKNLYKVVFKLNLV